MRHFVTILILLASSCLIGQNSGVSVNKLIVTQFGFEAGLQSEDITSLFIDSRGIFWVGTRGAGLFHFNEGRFETIPTISRVIGGSVVAICEREDGSLIIETASGNYRYDGRKIISEDEKTILCPSTISLSGLKGGETILSEIEQEMGARWVGTNKGLRSYNTTDSLWQYYTDAVGLLNDPVQAFVYDNNDVLWIGTKNNGLLRYVGPVSNSVDYRIPAKITTIRYNPVNGELVLWDEQGAGYTIHPSQGLNKFSGIDSLGIVSFFVDGLGYYWKERGNGNIEIVNWKAPDSIVFQLHLESRMRAFAYDRFNTVWIETEAGDLLRATSAQGKGHYQIARINSVVPNDNIVSLIASGGNQSFARGSQVYRIGDHSIGVVRNDRYEEIYSSDSKIQFAYLDDAGVIWFVTEESEIWILEEGKAPQKLVIPNPMRGAKVVFLQKKGNVLWVGTSQSMYQLSLDENQRNVIRGTSILKQAGSDLNTHSYTVMGDVAICVTSDKAVYLLQGQGFTPQEYTPGVFLSGVNLRDMPLSKSKYSNTNGAYARQLKPLSLSYRENTLTLSWQGLNAVPGTLMYSYRLRPDDKWSVPSGHTTLQLAEIAPGNYAFDVKVCDGKGNCGTLTSPWVFEIRKAIWQNWWFWTLAGLVGIIGLFILIKYREKKYKEKAARQLQFVTSKLHTIELEQKAMQLQMNPHFIFNAIQTIHHQLLNNEVRKAANSLVNFSTLMRTMLEMSRTDKVSLEDELEFLHAYVRVEQICRTEPIEFNINIDDGVEPFDTMIPSMMLQPVIENAIQYGGPRITLEIGHKGKYLRLRILDDGPGFPEEEIKKHKSVALTLLAERVKHMPGNGYVKYFNIEEGGDVRGACVELNVLESA